MGSNKTDEDGQPANQQAPSEQAKGEEASPQPTAAASQATKPSNNKQAAAGDKPASPKQADGTTVEASVVGTTPFKNQSDKAEPGEDSGDDEPDEGLTTLRRTRSSARGEQKTKRGRKESDPGSAAGKSHDAGEQDAGGPSKRPKREATKPAKPLQKRASRRASTEDEDDDEAGGEEGHDKGEEEQATREKHREAGGRRGKRPRVDAAAKPKAKDSTRSRKGGRGGGTSEDESDEGESSGEEGKRKEQRRGAGKEKRGGSPEPVKTGRGGRGGRGRGSRGRGEAGRGGRSRRRVQSVDDEDGESEPEGSKAGGGGDGGGGGAKDKAATNRANHRESEPGHTPAAPAPPAQEPLPDPTSSSYQQLNVEGKFSALSRALDAFNSHWEAAAQSAALVDQLVQSWYKVPFTTDSFIVHGKAIPKEMQGIAKRKESLLAGAASQIRHLVKVWRYMSEGSLAGSADEHVEAADGHAQRQHQQSAAAGGGGGEGGAILTRPSATGSAPAARQGRPQAQVQPGSKPGGGGGVSGQLPGRSSQGAGVGGGVAGSASLVGGSPDEVKVQAGSRQQQQQAGVKSEKGGGQDGQRLTQPGASLHQLRSPAAAHDSSSPPRNGVLHDDHDKGGKQLAGRPVSKQADGGRGGQGRLGVGREAGGAGAQAAAGVVTLSGFVSRHDTTRDASVCMLSSCLDPPSQQLLTPLEVALQIEQQVFDRCSDVSSGDDYARCMHILWGVLSTADQEEGEGKGSGEVAEAGSVRELLLAGDMTPDQLLDAIQARMNKGVS